MLDLERTVNWIVTQLVIKFYRLLNLLDMGWVGTAYSMSFFGAVCVHVHVRMNVQA